MKVKSEILVANVEMKANKDNVPYLSVGFISVDDGSMFNIVSKEMDLIEVLEPFKKYNIEFELKDSKYGMSLKILRVLDLL